MCHSWKPLNPNIPLAEQIKTYEGTFHVKGRLRGGSSEHIPTTSGPNLTTPWEGLLITELNAVIHLAKHSSKEVLLNAIAELNLTPDNLVMIYASAYFNNRGLEQETRAAEAE